MEKLYVVQSAVGYVSQINPKSVEFSENELTALVFTTYKKAYNIMLKCKRRGEECVYVTTLYSHIYRPYYWEQLKENANYNSK